MQLLIPAWDIHFRRQSRHLSAFSVISQHWVGVALYPIQLTSLLITLQRKEPWHQQHWQFYYLFNRIFRLTSSKTSKLLLALCRDKQQVTDGFPSQRDNDSKSVSMPWRVTGSEVGFGATTLVKFLWVYNAVKYRYNTAKYITLMHEGSTEHHSRFGHKN